MFRLYLLLIVALPATIFSQDPEKKEENRSPFKRRDVSTDEELRKQLQQVPELGLDQGGAAYVLSVLEKISNTPGAMADPDMAPKFYTAWTKQNKKTDMADLPWRFGVDSQTGKELAERLHVYSTGLRSGMRQAVPQNEVSPDLAKLKMILHETDQQKRFTFGLIGDPLKWNKIEALPTLAQMLQVENTSMRMLMVEMLEKIDGKDAGTVLAQRAIFDVSAQVRERAVEAIAKRPRKDCEQVLLDALRWPWTPAAEHAAEAIVALKAKDFAPALIGLLKEPDPKLAFIRESKKEKGIYVRELVRINHLCSCLLCHAPSMSRDDLVRGRIPDPNEVPPPSYYEGAFVPGKFVRADTVFLRQDFSIFQPVEKPGKWPAFQRYDYLIRTRKATLKEIALLKATIPAKGKEAPDSSYPQREAVLFALRELTGENRGGRTESWLPLLKGIESKKD